MIGLDTDPPGVAEMREHNLVLSSLPEAEHARPGLLQILVTRQLRQYGPLEPEHESLRRDSVFIRASFHSDRRIVADALSWLFRLTIGRSPIGRGAFRLSPHVQPPFMRKGSCLANGDPWGLKKRRVEMSEDVSRRKALSLLGLGAALGFTLSAALELSEAEAQEAAPAAAPAATTGTHGMNRRQTRRSGRHERRHTRRTGKPAAAAAPAGTTPAAPQ
jgi:hypothetical protein